MLGAQMGRFCPGLVRLLLLSASCQHLTRLGCLGGQVGSLHRVWGGPDLGAQDPTEALPWPYLSDIYRVGAKEGPLYC